MASATSTQQSDENSRALVPIYNFEQNRTSRINLDNCNFNKIVDYVSDIFGLGVLDVRRLWTYHHAMEFHRDFEIAPCLLSWWYRDRDVMDPDLNKIVRLEEKILLFESSLERNIQKAISICAGIIQEKLNIAHVKSFEELHAKSNQLSHLKELADYQYLSQSENCDVRKMIDLTTYPIEEETLINHYWDVLKNDQLMIKNHAKGEKLIRDMWGQWDVCILNLFKNLYESRISYPKGTLFNFPLKFDDQLQSACQVILDLFINDFILLCKDPGDLALKYFRTRVQALFMAKGNRFLRKFLTEDSYHRKIYDKKIEQYRSLQNDPIKWQTEIDQLEKEIIEVTNNPYKGCERGIRLKKWRIERNKSDIYYANKITSKYTERDFCLKFVLEDPILYDSFLEKLNVDWERKLYQTTKIKWGKWVISSIAGGQLIDKDIHVNLTELDDPNAHFLNLIKERDLQCLS